MKKTILLLVTLFVFSYSYSQITLDTTSTRFLTLIKLEKSGYKYWMSDLDSVILYNLDLTVFKQFPVVLAPGLAPGAAHPVYITEVVFNTDSTDVEYLLAYNNTSTSQKFTGIYDELGTVLLYVNNYYPVGGSLGQPLGSYAPNYLFAPVQNTTDGTKLFLGNSNPPFDMQIYNLPGSLPCNNCEAGSNPNAVNEINIHKENGAFNLFPNPFSKYISAEYYFPGEAGEGYIAVYNNTGGQLKKFIVKEPAGKIKLNCEEFSHGIYFFELVSEKGFYSGRKMIKL